MAETNWDEKLKSPEMKINPYPIYKLLRERAPIFYSEYLQAWFITKHSDTVEIIKNKNLSANKGPVIEKQLEKVGANLELLSQYTTYNEPVIAQADPPIHTKLRKVTSKAFTKKAIDSYEPTLVKVAREQLDRIDDLSAIDIYKDFAAIFPYKAISTLVGVPDNKFEEFHKLFGQIEHLISGSWESDMDVKEVERIFIEGNQAHDRFDDILFELAQQRKECPKEDMLSYLVSKEMPEDDDVSLRTIARLASVIVAAGSTTIAYQMPLILHTLLESKNKEKLEEFKANIDDDVYVNKALDELMRINSTVQFIHRVATDDIEVLGASIKKGDVIAVSLAAANHDPDEYPNPEEVDFERKNSKLQLGFGTGIHYCLGANLAKLEIKIALRELFAKYPNLRFDPNKAPVFSNDIVIFRGFTSFPVLVD